MIISTATYGDLPEIIRLENAEWSEEQRCSPENFLNRLNNFANGFLIARVDGELVATFYAIKRKHVPGEPINWLADSGNGSGSTHDESGNSLFSISCTVSRKAPRGTYRKMMQAWRDLAQDQNVEYMYAGSRAVGIAKFAGALPDYLEKVKSGQIFDPILSKAKYCGFSIGNLIPAYFDDPDSLDYGVEIYQAV